MKAHLPPAAHSLYYNDQIGNISTSDTRKTALEVGSVEGVPLMCCISARTGKVQCVVWHTLLLHCPPPMAAAAYPELQKLLPGCAALRVLAWAQSFFCWCRVCR